MKIYDCFTYFDEKMLLDFRLNYLTALTIDGNAITPKWQNGVAPTAGNANSIDIYSFTIVKTGSATFTAFGSQTKFA
jgi:hypothetical protein